MIGDLYDAGNVVVGQAAVFFAAENTALPSFSKWNIADPFDPAFLLTHTLATGTATSFTLTYTKDGNAQTTSTLTVAGLTAAQIQSALEALSNVGVGNVVVTGASTPWSIVFKGDAEGGVLSETPTGGTMTLTEPLWTPVGATDQGWQFGANKSTQSITIEEQSTPVGVTITSQNVTLAGALSEDITRTLALALNASSAATAPATGVPGYDTVTLTDSALRYAVVMVTTNAAGFGRIIYAPAWTQLSNAAVSFRRASDKRQYPVQFETVCKTTDIKVFNFNHAGI